MSFTEFYVQPTGSNLNAGSTDDDTAVHTYASGTWVNSTGIFTVASGNPSSDGVQVGDFASVYPDAASVTPYVGQVTNVTSTTITVSATYASGTPPADGTTDTTLKIGGAWEGPNGSEIFPFNFATENLKNTSFDNPRVNIKGGTNYDITASITQQVGGLITFQGYTTTPGDYGRAVIDGGTSGASYILLDVSLAADNSNYLDLTFQNNGATGSATGINVAATAPETVFRRVTVHDVRGWGAVFTTQVLATDILAYNCNQSDTSSLGGVALQDGYYARIISRDNNRTGIRYSSTVGGLTALHNVISTRNTGIGFNSNNHRSPVAFINCISYDNGGDGFSEGGSGAQQTNVIFENCIIAENGGWGIDMVDSISTSSYNLRNVAFRNNTSGEVNPVGGSTNTGLINEDNRITLTADPFVDAANDDFNLNDTAGGGTVLRAVELTLVT